MTATLIYTTLLGIIYFIKNYLKKSKFTNHGR